MQNSHCLLGLVWNGQHSIARTWIDLCTHLAQWWRYCTILVNVFFPDGVEGSQWLSLNSIEGSGKIECNTRRIKAMQKGATFPRGKKQEHWSSIIAPFPIWLASSLPTTIHLGILPPDIEYLNIVRKRVLLEKVQKYFWVANFTMDHITKNYSAHFDSPSVKQLCEQTRVHRWEPISDKMFTNKRIDLLANLGTSKLFANGKHR